MSKKNLLTKPLLSLINQRYNEQPRSKLRNFINPLVGRFNPLIAVLFLSSKKCLTCDNINLEPNLLCFSCWNKIEFISNINQENLSVAKYGKISETIIHSLKYHDNHEYAAIMAKFISFYIKTHNLSFDYIIPIPISQKKLSERKFNHAALIAKGVSDINNKTLLWNSLLKTSDTPSQTSLTASQRKRNLKGKFSINPKTLQKLENKTILLIDDVTTTNSTLHECISSLKIANPRKILTVTYAKTYL